MFSNMKPLCLKSEKELWMSREIRRLHKNIFISSRTSSRASASNSSFNRHHDATSLLKFRCIICFDDFNKKEIAVISCNHYFCKACWGEYCRNKLVDAEEITCPLCRNSIERSVEPIPIIYENCFRYLTSVTLMNEGSRSSREFLQSSIQHSYSQHLVLLQGGSTSNG